MNLTKTCPKCGETKPLDEFHKSKTGKYGRYNQCKICKNARIRKYRQEHREKLLIHRRELYKEHKNELIEKGECEPMYENKLCPQYLGIVIGERLCRHLFKDVEVMPIHNAGYDIVCSHGKRIDVKTACMTLVNKKYPRWGFNIRMCTAADYFICVAFDNVKDLNPLHIWMIPGKEINHLTGISIRPSTLHKWSQWERDINNAQLCCAEMKKEK